jgi:regulator of sigma E protease
VLTAAILLILVANGLILVHELGHLFAAKWAGMPVQSFSVGFGPPLFAFRIGPTRYQLALVPLGGFVRIMGMRGTEEERREWPTGFAFQSLGRRICVVSAGVLANAWLAAILFAGLALTGGATVPTPARVEAVFEEDLPAQAEGWAALPRNVDIVRLGEREVKAWGEFALALLGTEAGSQLLYLADGSRLAVSIPETEYERVALLQALLPPLPPVLGRIDAGSPAEASGLRTGDRIVAVDGAPVKSFMDWLEAAPVAPTGSLTLRILRDGGGLDVVVAPPAGDYTSMGSLGWIGANLGTEQQATDVGGAVAYGAREVERHTRLIAESGRLLVTGAVGLREVAGPVQIARMSNLAILNFLPIPVLDGGHFALLLAEGVAGRPLPAGVYRYGNVAGATVVVFFMAFALLNDFLKLFGF